MSINRAEYGSLNHHARVYGRSTNGLSLKIYEPSDLDANILLMGSIHGDEGLTTVLLSECLRSITSQELKAAVILCANPDGLLAGTRCNARGVDLNRNYPTANWQADPVFYRNRPEDPQNIPLSPGTKSGSESETQALIALIKSSKPKLIVSFHGFISCIDDPQSSRVAHDIAERTNLELVPDVGYATPGSFGSWCAEEQIPIITYELPSLGIVETRKIHLPVLRDLMTGHYRSML